MLCTGRVKSMHLFALPTSLGLPTPEGPNDVGTAWIYLIERNLSAMCNS